MKVSSIIGLLSIAVLQVHAQVPTREPTHIIKFKGTPDFNGNSAAQFFTARFQEFVAFATLEDHILSSSFDTASLTSMQLSKNFHAVSGIFHQGFAQYLASRPDVEYVEKNEIFKAVRAIAPPQQQEVGKRAMEQFKAPSWGLARIFHRENGIHDTYSADGNSGAGVTVYVLDSGVNLNHQDLQGRASSAANFVSNEDENDYAGHGTHVAGTIAGSTFGVAKKASIKSVKILDKNGDGTTSGLLQALEYVAANATPGKSLINLSLSGPRSKLIEDAIYETAKARNIPMFVSAGNTGDDACKYLPAASIHAFAVGATDDQDRIAYYSSVGSCVRMYAPGTGIISAWAANTTASMKLDGTSMANPHVAGIAASLLSQRSYANIEEVYSDLEQRGSKGILTTSVTQSYNNLPVNNNLAFAG